jgi:hypothetical protein
MFEVFQYFRSITVPEIIREGVTLLANCITVIPIALSLVRNP